MSKSFPSTSFIERFVLSFSSANELYEYCISECDKAVPGVQRGVFGADMKIELENDGPFTIVLDSDKL